MTLLKADRVSALDRRRRLGPDAPVPSRFDAVEPSAEASRLAELEEALRIAEDRATALEATLERRERDAFERGRDEGDAAAVARMQRTWNDQRDAFREALAACTAQIDRRFAELEAFALDLAESALAPLVGDDARRRELLAATIAHHVGTLAADTVLAIHVSPDDVPDAADIAASLPVSLASRIRVNEAVDAGSCRVELLSGSLDIGLRSQVARVCAALGKLRA